MRDGGKLRHVNINSGILQMNAVLGPHMDASKDRVLACIPFFHIFGMVGLVHLSLLWGTPLTVMSKFDLPLFCNVIQTHKISFSCLVPPILVLLAKHPIVDQYDLSSLRKIACGAAPLSAELANDVQARLPHCRIVQGYGLTETSPVVTVGDLDHPVSGK